MDTETPEDRITVDPDPLVGKPVVRGTRISVERIVRTVREGVAREELLEAYPGLEPDDIQAALNYAADHPDHFTT
jgi:uncharacterized protein (DUF433 family)